jgi:hypothetical protein
MNAAQAGSAMQLVSMMIRSACFDGTVLKDFMRGLGSFSF